MAHEQSGDFHKCCYVSVVKSWRQSWMMAQGARGFTEWVGARRMRLSPVSRSTPCRERCAGYGHNLSKRAAIRNKIEYSLRSANAPGHELQRRSLCRNSRACRCEQLRRLDATGSPSDEKNMPVITEEISGMAEMISRKNVAFGMAALSPEPSRKSSSRNKRKIEAGALGCHRSWLQI